MTSFPLRARAFPQKHVIHKRSMSESALEGFAAPRTPEWSIAVQGDRTPGLKEKVVVSRERSASASASDASRTTSKRPRPRHGVFDFSAALTSAVAHIPDQLKTGVAEDVMSRPSHLNTAPNPPKPQQSRSNSFNVRIAPLPPPPVADMRERATSSPAPISPTKLRKRAGSAVSTTSDYTIQSSPPPERKLSAASNSSVPFVIAMSSPHNPALMTPSAAALPTSCSITRNAPLKLVPPTSRTGVGGTMASSPVSRSDVRGLEPPPRPMSTKPTQSTLGSIVRKTSLRSRNQVSSPPHTPSHSRSVSGSTIRTVIRLPKTRGKETDQEMHRVRKDSISVPRPLGSPFGLERAMSVGSNGHGHEEHIIVGEAV
jgi:hypothetical protein